MLSGPRLFSWWEKVNKTKKATSIFLISFLEANGTDVSVACLTRCTLVPSVRNSSLNYQVEKINISCSQTLMSMTIIQVVQRVYNETPAQHYQSFWNSSINITFVQNPSEIIYTWFSLPDMVIVRESFPNFIEAQFYYTSGSTRVTGNDVWLMSARTICEEQLYFTGTF